MFLKSEARGSSVGRYLAMASLRKPIHPSTAMAAPLAVAIIVDMFFMHRTLCPKETFMSNIQVAFGCSKPRHDRRQDVNARGDHATFRSNEFTRHARGSLFWYPLGRYDVNAPYARDPARRGEYTHEGRIKKGRTLPQCPTGW